MGQKSSFRIRLLSGCIILLALVLVFRLYIIQIAQGDEFSQLADRQYVQSSHNLYDRGTIFFEDKDGRMIAGASIKSGFLVAINPEQVSDVHGTYNALVKLIELDRDAFFMRAEKKDDPYEEIAHNVESDVAHAIEKLNLPGVRIYRERWRYYPGNTLASQTLGFVGYNGDQKTGLYGIERYYEDVLKRNSANLHVNFFAEIFSNISQTLMAKERVRAGNIVTSIEPSVQQYLEESLARIDETWGAKRTGGIVMDPNTGQIYAMAVTPTFNVNEYSKEKNPNIFSNMLVEDVYEMGSIIKPITMAIGLDTKAVTAQTTYNDPGVIVVNDYQVSNYDGRARGIVSMQEVLNQSLNTGVAYVVDRVGHKRFKEYMQNFELGEETGIDLPNEAFGMIDNLESPRSIEYVTASFGQGIALTPIATVRALAALANGGRLVTPHVGKRIEYENGVPQEISFEDTKQVIAPETSEEISRMLTEVVDSALLGGKVALPNYSIAAKTGTAEIARPTGGGYYEDRYLHSFFGYFPSYEPRFLVFLFTIEPRGAKYASETLTYPFMDITKFLINYYEIPPDREGKHER